jgi:hypothetical protein
VLLDAASSGGGGMAAADKGAAAAGCGARLLAVRWCDDEASAPFGVRVPPVAGERERGERGAEPTPAPNEFDEGNAPPPPPLPPMRLPMPPPPPLLLLGLWCWPKSAIIPVTAGGNVTNDPDISSRSKVA